MARYIDADKLTDMCKEITADDWNKRTSPVSWADAYEGFVEDIDEQPTADVVPRAEYNELWYKLEGVMHSVDKWLDGEELNQDEVNRAATMREKTLRIVENARTEVAREIFEEIGKILAYNYLGYAQCYQKAVASEIAELKNKYTGG